MKTDREVLMMDAGTAYFESKDGMGSVLGQIKAEMKAWGKVLTPEEIPADELPHSTGDYDFFLNFSSVWRYRHISCKLYFSGDTGRKTTTGEPICRYSAELKEGNKSGPLRTGLYILVVLCLIAGVFYGSIWMRIINIILVPLFVYLWLMPDTRARKVSEALKWKIERYP